LLVVVLVVVFQSILMAVEEEALEDIEHQQEFLVEEEALNLLLRLVLTQIIRLQLEVVEQE
jgi:hypothetical protein